VQNLDDSVEDLEDRLFSNVPQDEQVQRQSRCSLAFSVRLGEHRERDVWLVSGYDPGGWLPEGFDGVLAAGRHGPVAKVRAP
jgi:hypothetical protein